MNYIRKHFTLLGVICGLIGVITLGLYVYYYTPVFFLYQLRDQLSKKGVQHIEEIIDRQTIVKQFIKQHTQQVADHLKEKSSLDDAMLVMLFPKILDYIIYKVTQELTASSANKEIKKIDKHLEHIGKQWLGDWQPTISSMRPTSIFGDSDWILTLGTAPSAIYVTFHKNTLYDWKITKVDFSN